MSTDRVKFLYDKNNPNSEMGNERPKQAQQLPLQPSSQSQLQSQIPLQPQMPMIPRVFVPVQGRVRQCIEMIKVNDLTSFKDLFPKLDPKMAFDFDLKEDNRVDLAKIIFPNLLREMNLLHLCAWYSAHDILDFLLKNGYKLRVNESTSEGITPLHLAAAVGDFVSIRTLTKYFALVTAVDAHSRTPLHYAIREDPKCAVILTGLDDSLINHYDANNKTPIDLAVESGYRDLTAFFQAVQDYRTELGDAPVEPPVRVMDDPENMHESLWIPYNFECWSCIKPKRDVLNQSFCVCKTALSDHRVITTNNQLLSTLIQKKQFVSTPTNAFGKIEWSSNSYVSQYARLSDDTDPEKVITLLTKVWGLPNPQLVLTFYGTQINSQAIMEKIRRLVWKASANTVTWVITNGLLNSVSAKTTESVKECIEAYGHGQISSIGIAPWRFITSNKNLVSSSYTGLSPAEYTPEKEESPSHALLDENITHYVLVDSDSVPKPSYELNFRTKLEKALKDWTDKEAVTQSPPIQVCGILTGGDETTLRGVYCAVQSGVPFVILRESGGLAEILIQCMEDTLMGYKARHKKAIREGSRDADTFQLSPANIKQTVSHHWATIEHPESVILMIQELLDRPQQLSVCELEEDKENELDYHILSLLMNPLQVYEAGRLNVPLLEISIGLNRSDVAREKVFAEGIKCENQIVSKYIDNLLLGDKVDFIKLFIEKGFNLSAYMTPDVLELLYTYSVCTDTPKVALFNAIRAFIKVPKKIFLPLVGRTLQALIGSQFHSVYLEKQFSLSFQSDLEPDTKLFENPATDLFIWALLTERNEQAEYFWTQIQDPLSGALFAALLLRRLSLHTDSLVSKDEMFEKSQTFENRAYDLLSECFNDSPPMAFEAIIRERVLYGGMSCLMLAAEGGSMNFISHRCCEQYLKNVWNGAIDPNTKMLPFLISLFIGLTFPPLIPLSLKFKLDNKLNTKGPDPRMKRPIIINPIIEDKKKNASKDTTTSRRKSFHYFQKLKGFYLAPCVRFSYTTISFIAFLCFFTYFVLFTLDLKLSVLSPQNILVYIWVLSFIIENIWQGFNSGVPFRAYIGKLWKCLELVAIVLFILGTALQLMVLAEEEARSIQKPVNPVSAIQEALTQLARIFYGISLCAFFHRLLELFTVNIRLGPMVIMVQTMIVQDLFPFLALFIVVLFGFAVLQWVAAFTNTASLDPSVNIMTLFTALRFTYYQIFGEYEMESLTGEKKLDECTKDGINCPGSWAFYVSPVLLGIYVIMTQVLLLNLVIAMFATTFVKIEAASTNYWALQRYHIMREYINRSPIPPPFIIVWHLIKGIRYMICLCARKKRGSRYPFRRSYRDNIRREKQLIHWERLRFWDYYRYVLQGYLRKKKGGGGGGKAVSVRTTLIAPGGGNIDDNFRASLQQNHQATQEGIDQIEKKLSKLKQLEDKVDQIMKLLSADNRQSNQKEPPITSQMSLLERQQPLQSQTSLSKANRLKATKIKEVFPRSAYKRSLSADAVKAKDPGDEPVLPQIAMLDDGKHRMATFVPPTADRTPTLFPRPQPWDIDVPETISLGWKPLDFRIPDWTQPVQYSASIELLSSQTESSTIVRDPNTGAPRNPAGRTGVNGRGHLPVWGPNPALILVVTHQSGRTEASSSSSTKRDSSGIEYLVYQHLLFEQLPWFLIQHPAKCDHVSCVRSLISMLVQGRANDLGSQNPRLVSTYNTAVKTVLDSKINVFSHGYLNDVINTDNAWIEPVIVNIDLGQASIDRTIIPQLFATEGVKLEWQKPGSGDTMRRGHDTALEMVLKRFR